MLSVQSVQTPIEQGHVSRDPLGNYISLENMRNVTGRPAIKLYSNRQRHSSSARLTSLLGPAIVTYVNEST